MAFKAFYHQTLRHFSNMPCIRPPSNPHYTSITTKDFFNFFAFCLYLNCYLWLESAFLFSLLDILLSSFSTMLKCQILFKDFSTSLTSLQIISSTSLLLQYFLMNFILHLLNCVFLHLNVSRCPQ